MGLHELDHYIIPEYQNRLKEIFEKEITINLSRNTFIGSESLYDMIGQDVLPAIAAFMSSTSRKRLEPARFYKQRVSFIRFSLDNALAQSNATLENEELHITLTKQYTWNIQDNINYRLMVLYENQNAAD